MVYSSLLIGIILGSIITWAIARTRQPNEAPPPIEPGPGTCPLCDEYLPGRAATTPMLCRTCGWRPAASIDQARTSALRALSVRALRMLQQGLLTPESYEHVSTVLSKEEDRYAEPVLPFAWHPPAAAVAAPSGLQQTAQHRARQRSKQIARLAKVLHTSRSVPAKLLTYRTSTTTCC